MAYRRTISITFSTDAALRWAPLAAYTVSRRRSPADGDFTGPELPLLILWTAPATGIAMRQDTVDVAERFESAYGYKQTYRRPKSTSAYPPTADIPAVPADFRLCEGLSDACRVWVSATGSIGRRRTSLRGGNRGPFMLGGAGGSVYGELTAAGWLAWVARSAGLQGSGHPRQRPRWICNDFAVALVEFVG